jgi:hypothetical protein
MTSLFESEAKSQETCPNVAAAFERPRKGVQVAVGISAFPKMIPSPACRFAWQKR